MEHNYGKELAMRETQKTPLVVLKIMAFVVAPLLFVLSIFLLFADDGFYREEGIVLLVLSVPFFSAMLFLSKVLYSQVFIYEEGVIVKNFRKEYRFHYNEIAGLREPLYGAVVVVPVGGIVSGLITAAALGIASGIADEKRREKLIREIVIQPKNGKAVGVVKTGGDELSQVYTGWLIKNIPVTKENLNSLSLSFGKKLEFNNGALVQKKRSGDIRLALSDVIDFDARDGLLHYYGLNKKGKKAIIITAEIRKIMNLDLLLLLFSFADT
jgi:hypothetical protein